jgi:hypothetical protein
VRQLRAVRVNPNNCFRLSIKFDRLGSSSVGGVTNRLMRGQGRSRSFTGLVEIQRWTGFEPAVAQRAVRRRPDGSFSLRRRSRPIAGKTFRRQSCPDDRDAASSYHRCARMLRDQMPTSCEGPTVVKLVWSEASACISLSVFSYDCHASKLIDDVGGRCFAKPYAERGKQQERSENERAFEIGKRVRRNFAVGHRVWCDQPA